MASVFGHAVSAYGLGKIFPEKLITTKVMLLGMASAILPDADVISYHFGIWHDHPLGHRGLTHSFFFAFIWAITLIVSFHRKLNRKNQANLLLYYFICTVSHGILDAMTTGGAGIAFFLPFSEDRYFLPWRIIEVSPIGIGAFFNRWGLEVLLNEFIVIGLPVLMLVVVVNLIKKV